MDKAAFTLSLELTDVDGNVFDRVVCKVEEEK